MRIVRLIGMIEFLNLLRGLFAIIKFDLIFHFVRCLLLNLSRIILGLFIKYSLNYHDYILLIHSFISKYPLFLNSFEGNYLTKQFRRVFLIIIWN